MVHWWMLVNCGQKIALGKGPPIALKKNTVNPFYNQAFGDHLFLVTLTNCDLNVYSHIPYKPLQGCDYRQK
jgi:hypothetical protein